MMKLEEIRKLSEKELSTQIIIPLLKKLDFKSVNYTCGADEFGRDIVFYNTDAFGNKKWKGIQVKTVNIHAISSKKGNVQEIINQMQEAFDNPYFHPASGEEIRINEMHIITSGKITPKAQRVIKNKFKQKPVYFIDGQELACHLERHLPDILEKIDETKRIKEKIQELLTSKKDLDLRDLEDWFSKREILELDEKSMNFISSQIFKWAFKNPLRFRKVDWKILSWLEDLKDSEKILTKEIKEFLENFPYYSEFEAPELVFSFLKSLKKLKDISPETCRKLKIDVHLFFRNVKKSMDVLRYPSTWDILTCIVEESDALADFYDGKKIDLQEKYVFPTLIGMQEYSVAKLFLTKTKNPEKHFAQSFMLCVRAGLEEGFKKSESNIVIKFSEFLKKSKLGTKIFRHLPANYGILLFWGLGKDKEASKLLKLEETFNRFRINTKVHLPKACRLFLGSPNDFFVKIEGTQIPKIPEIYYEMAELKYEIGDFNASIKLIDTALDNSGKIKEDYWITKFMKMHKAECLFNLKRYPECLEISEKLIDEHNEMAYRLYEACKRALKK